MGQGVPQTSNDLKPLQWEILRLLMEKGALTRKGIIKFVFEKTGREYKNTTIHDNVGPLVIVGIVRRKPRYIPFVGRPAVAYEINTKNGCGEAFSLQQFIEEKIEKFWSA